MSRPGLAWNPGDTGPEDDDCDGACESCGRSSEECDVRGEECEIGEWCDDCPGESWCKSRIS